MTPLEQFNPVPIHNPLVSSSSASQRTSRYLSREVSRNTAKPKQFRGKKRVKRTRVALPVKVIARITAAFQVQSSLPPRRAMREWYVVIGDVIEEMDFLLLEQKCGRNRVHRSVAPSFVEESAVFVKGFKKIDVGRRS